MTLVSISHNIPRGNHCVIHQAPALNYYLPTLPAASTTVGGLLRGTREPSSPPPSSVRPTDRQRCCQDGGFMICCHDPARGDSLRKIVQADYLVIRQNTVACSAGIRDRGPVFQASVICSLAGIRDLLRVGKVSVIGGHVFRQAFLIYAVLLGGHL